MTVRAHLGLIIATVLVGAIAFGTLLAMAWQATSSSLAREAGAGTQLEAFNDLNGAAGRYGRQVVNQIAFGYMRSGDLQTARNDMDRALAALARATRDELRAFAGSDELQDELPELEAVRRMTDLYHVIDASAKRALNASTSGNPDEAATIVNREVDFRLTNELQPLIDAGIAEERAELAGQRASQAAAQARLFAATAVVLPLVVAITALLVWLLARQIGSNRRAAEADAHAEKARLEQMLARIEDSRGRLLADISHQLRTPLTVLRGEADVALRGNTDSADLRESLQRVRAQAAELALLLDSLLDAARTASEAQPGVMRPLRIADLATLAADEGRMLAEPREVTLATVLDDGGVEVDGDLRQLKQVLMIGIDNAVKHSAPGSSIELSTHVVRGRAVLRLTDSGPGIAPEDEPYLFQRFFRGRGEEEMLNPGFGIGLAIAKNVVERHGGEIALRNRETGGALLEITLPLRAAP